MADDGQVGNRQLPNTDGGSNVITQRHRGKGEVNFCDGHAEVKDYLFVLPGINNNPNL